MPRGHTSLRALERKHEIPRTGRRATGTSESLEGSADLTQRAGGHVDLGQSDRSRGVSLTGQRGSVGLAVASVRRGPVFWRGVAGGACDGARGETGTSHHHPRRPASDGTSSLAEVARSQHASTQRGHGEIGLALVRAACARGRPLRAGCCLMPLAGPRAGERAHWCGQPCRQITAARPSKSSSLARHSVVSFACAPRKRVRSRSTSSLGESLEWLERGGMGGGRGVRRHLSPRGGRPNGFVSDGSSRQGPPRGLSEMPTINEGRVVPPPLDRFYPTSSELVRINPQELPEGPS